MKNTLIKLPDYLFESAAFMCVEGSLEVPELRTASNIFTPTSNATWKATITNTGNFFLVKGTVCLSVETSCSRCLEPARYQLEGSIEHYILFDANSANQNEIELDECSILSKKHEFDIELPLMAALQLSLPLVPLCSADCKGLCQYCGANLNTSQCNCKAEKKAEQNPFSVLKDMSFDFD